MALSYPCCKLLMPVCVLVLLLLVQPNIVLAQVTRNVDSTINSSLKARSPHIKKDSVRAMGDSAVENIRSAVRKKPQEASNIIKDRISSITEYRPFNVKDS